MHFVTSHKGLEKRTYRIVKNTRTSRGEKQPGGVERKATSPNSTTVLRQQAHSWSRTVQSTAANTSTPAIVPRSAPMTNVFHQIKLTVLCRGSSHLTAGFGGLRPRNICHFHQKYSPHSQHGHWALSWAEVLINTGCFSTFSEWTVMWRCSSNQLLTFALRQEVSFQNNGHVCPSVPSMICYSAQLDVNIPDRFTSAFKTRQ